MKGVGRLSLLLVICPLAHIMLKAKGIMLVFCDSDTDIDLLDDHKYIFDNIEVLSCNVITCPNSLYSGEFECLAKFNVSDRVHLDEVLTL